MARTTRGGRRIASAARAARLHDKALLIDGEGVAVLLPTTFIPQPAVNGHSFLDRAIASGLTAMNVSLGIGGIAMGVDNFRALIHTIFGHLRYFDFNRDKIIHVEGVNDILRAKKERKLGVIFGLQGLAPKIDNDPGLLRVLHKLGLRVAQLTHNTASAFGCGCLEVPDTGLTQRGREAIYELNRLGIVLDLAHGGDRTAREAIELSAAPCIFSHANAYGLNPNPRNVTEDALRTLAKRGGVIGISAYSPFCETKPGVRPTLDDFIDHVAYVADLVGIDHVGVGTDFFEAESEVRFSTNTLYHQRAVRGYVRGHKPTIYAEGLERVDHFPRLTEGLVKRKFSDRDILQVLGNNFMRVFREVWKS